MYLGSPLTFARASNNANKATNIGANNKSVEITKIGREKEENPPLIFGKPTQTTKDASQHHQTGRKEKRRNITYHHH